MNSLCTIRVTRRAAMMAFGGISAATLSGCKLGIASAQGPRSSVDVSCDAPKDQRAVRSQLLIVSDLSTVFEGPDRRQIARELPDLAEALGGHVAVMTFGGTGSALIRKSYETSFPPAQASTEHRDSRWSTTPAATRKAQACVAASRNDLVSAIEHVLEDVDLNGGNSPVFEALAAVLGTAESRGSTRTTVALLSDGIVHTPPTASWYVPGTDRLRMAPPDQVVAELKRRQLLPDARGGVRFLHLGIGLSGPVAKGKTRLLRPANEIRNLEQRYAAAYAASGAEGWTFGHPLLADFRAAASRT